MRHYLTPDDQDTLAEYRLRADSTINAIHPRAAGARDIGDTSAGSHWDAAAGVAELHWQAHRCPECQGNAMVILAGILLPCSTCYGMGHIGHPQYSREPDCAPERSWYDSMGDLRYRVADVNDRQVIYRPKRIPKVNPDGSLRKRGRPKGTYKLTPAIPGDATLFYTGESAHIAMQTSEM